MGLRRVLHEHRLIQVGRNSDVDSQAGEEALGGREDAGRDRGRINEAGCGLHIPAGGRGGSPQNEAAVGAIDTGGEVRDAESFAWGAEDGTRGRHAVDHGEDLELGLEFIRDEVDRQIGVADGVFDGKDEIQTCVRDGWGEICFGVPETGGKDVFDDDVVACGETALGEVASGRTRTDDGDNADPWCGFVRLGHYFATAKAATTDS